MRVGSLNRFVQTWKGIALFFMTKKVMATIGSPYSMQRSSSRGVDK